MITGYNIYQGSMKDLIDLLVSNKQKYHVVSGNPEVLLTGLETRSLYNNFNSNSSIIIADGVGVLFPLRLKGYKLNKITGIELFTELLKKLNGTEKGVYLLGASQEVNETLVQKLKLQYDNLRIVGHHHGFIDLNNCDDIIRDIDNSNAYAVFVAMGCPRQEKFIMNYFDEIQCNIMMGVGGVFDVISGKTKRAPKIFQKLHLEWLYRITKEPVRIKRFKRNIKYMFISLKEVITERIK